MRDIPGYEGLYQIDDLGQIWRKGAPRNRPLKPAMFSGGYPGVTLSKDAVHTSRTVHSLVAEVFLGPCPEGQEVRHRDGVRANNHPSNLEYGTRKENAGDMVEHGTVIEGSKHYNVKLTEEQVLEIRATPKYTRGLVQKYGVSDAQIARIRAGKSWMCI